MLDDDRSRCPGGDGLGLPVRPQGGLVGACDNQMSAW